MKRIYVAGPFRAPNALELHHNVSAAMYTGMRVAEMGAAPLIPHTMYHHFDRTLTDEYWLKATQVWMQSCDAMVLCAGWRKSTGTLAEIEAFTRPVFEHLPDLAKWLIRDGWGEVHT